MKAIEFFVKRPITTIMLMFAIFVLGVMSLWMLKIELMPKMTFPNMVVYCEYSGVAPLEIEKVLTKPLETAVRSVPGIKTAKSMSSEGVSIINAEFNWGINLDDAANQIRDRIGQIKQFLPEGASDPIIMKVDMSAIPVAFMSMRGNISLEELQKLVDDIIQPRIERLDGVAAVYAIGGRDREIQINVDRKKLYSYGISLSQIVAKIRAENMNVSAGNIDDSADTEYLIRGIGEFKNVEEFKNIIVSVKNSVPIYLKDIAVVNDGFSDEKGLARVGKMRSVSVIIQKETDANTVDVARRLKAALPGIRKELPKDTTFDFVMDMSEMIEDSINALKNSALEGALLAAVIIFLFLGRIKPTLIILISIPVSLLIAFIAMYFSKSTLNIMTMGGLLIALGRLVDDSIVVMENIFRHRQMGKNSVNAAIDGAKEVGIAVISSTLVTVIVFLPIVFAQGIAVQLFKDFGLTVFFALMGSLLVAFTIVPMLGSKLFKKEMVESKSQKKSYFEKIKEFYAGTLNLALHHKSAVIGAALIMLLMTGVLFKTIGKEFIPSFTSGIYQLYCKLPNGSNLDSTDKLMARIEERVSKIPDLERMSIIVGTSKMGSRMAATSGRAQGSNSAQAFIKLKKGKERITSESEIYNIIDKIAKENTGAEIRLASASSQMFGTSRAIEIKVYGKDLDLLKRIGDDIADKIKNIKGLKSVSSSMEKGLPEIAFEYNKDKLTKYGLTAWQVNNDVNIAIDGQVASIYREAGEEIDIRVRLKPEYRKSYKDLLDVPIASPAGFMFPLKDVAKTRYSESPAEISRENAKRLVNISADISGRPLSDTVKDVKNVLDKTYLPEGYFYEFGGQEKDRRESFMVLAAALLMAMLLIYMILASLYESLIHPFTILLSVPFAFTGAIVALFISGIPLGVTALIGLIMLVGIVATNAIVMIDFIIKKREEEHDRKKAIVEAATVRLRPILMTAIATLFALLPVALGRAEGMELQIPLGITVVGGLFSSTLLTLYIIPVVYEIFDSLHKSKHS